VWTIQGNYAAFHKHIFAKDGNFEQKSWVDWEGPRDELCGAVLTKEVFLGSVLFLWVGRMTGELKTCVRLFQAVSGLPGVPENASLSHTVLERNGQSHIIGMSCFTRLTLYSFVIIPKTFLCLALMVVGCQWLTATESFADLILNALALEFIVGIDEAILENFLSQRAKTTVANTLFAYPSKGPLDAEKDLHNMVTDYRRNIGYMVFALSFTILWLFKLQQVIPNYSWDIGAQCGEWYMNRFKPRCQPFEKDCFPFGNVTAQHKYDAVEPF